MLAGGSLDITHKLHTLTCISTTCTARVLSPLQTCVPDWNECRPDRPDSCCPGSFCKATYKGCPSGEYVCKPNHKCAREGQHCAGKNDGGCCGGGWLFINSMQDHFAVQGSLCRNIHMLTVPPSSHLTQEYGGLPALVTHSPCILCCDPDVRF